MSARGQGARRALALSVLLLVSAAASVCMLGVGVAAARATASSEIRIAPSEARQARRFWTSARIRRAKPLEVHPVRGRGIGPFSLAGRDRGTPSRIPALAPRASVKSSRFEQVPDPTVEGLRQNGVIFVEVEEGLGRCSGTSVNAPNFSVVFTAAHCIGFGEEPTNWVFIPGYRYGQRPFGVFPAKWLGTTREWSESHSENADVGAAVVVRNERGERLAKAVGGTGIAWGLPPNQTFDVHGYPVEVPFDGETQRLCAGTPFLGHDPESFLWPGPLDNAVDCDVTGGASGGGWTIPGGILNGVTDYGYPDDPATDYGSYFGKEVARLYGRAARIR